MALRRWAWISLLVAAVALGIAYGFMPRAIPVDTARASRGALVVTVEEEGKTRVRERYTVTAPVEGYLQRVTLDAGDRVRRGQTVAAIEPPRSSVHDPRTRAETEAALAVAKAAMRGAEERERAVRARRDFLANLSHEIKTPITAIHGYAETLREEPLPPADKVRSFAEAIHRQSRRLLAMVGDLLALSRIEEIEERGALERREEKVAELLETAVQACAPQGRAAGIRIQVACDPQLTARVDRRLLEQAVENLVDNAVKYSLRGRSVEVTARRDGETLEIQVRDQGIGIPAEAIPRIFERLYRVDKGRSRDRGGTGLGLAIVKHVAWAHGGRVTVSSQPGRGSTFTLRVPV